MSSVMQAREDFATARRKAFRDEVVAFLHGRPDRLLSWDEVRDSLGVGGQIYRGMQTVRVDEIIGSVGRYRDFNHAFLPKRSAMANRWYSIARAYYADVSLPPVKLYKIGDAYFVLDGNHRVSVAREQGVEFLDAEVIEVETRVPVTAELDADDLEIKGEYAHFLARTQLDELRPGQSIEFTIGGGYERLLEHIAVHRYFMGLERAGFVSDDEAVQDWYDSLYAPLVSIIREKSVLDDFPGRTEADLYLWIMDHQHYLREECGPDVSTEQAAEHFADHYSARPLRRVWRAVRDWFANPACRVDGEELSDGNARQSEYPARTLDGS